MSLDPKTIFLYTPTSSHTFRTRYRGSSIFSPNLDFGYSSDVFLITLTTRATSLASSTCTLNAHDELCLDPRPNIVVSASGIPISDGESSDGSHEEDNVVHLKAKLASQEDSRWEWKPAYVLSRHRSNRRHNVNDGDKRRPNNSPNINRQAHCTKMERSALEFAILHLADNWNAVRPVQSNGSEIENSTDSNVRPETDQIDQDTGDAEQPDSVDGSIGCLVDLVPEAGTWQHLVTRKGPDGPGTGLNCSHSGKIQDEACGDNKEDASIPANHVVEDLSHWLIHNVPECVRWVTTTVGEHDGEEPATNPGEAESECN